MANDPLKQARQLIKHLEQATDELNHDVAEYQQLTSAEEEKDKTKELRQRISKKN